MNEHLVILEEENIQNRSISEEISPEREIGFVSGQGIVESIATNSSNTFVIQGDELQAFFEAHEECDRVCLYLLPSVEVGQNADIYLFFLDGARILGNPDPEVGHKCFIGKGTEDAIEGNLVQAHGRLRINDFLYQNGSTPEGYFKATFEKDALQAELAENDKLRFDIVRRPHTMHETIPTLAFTRQTQDGELADHSIVHLLPCPPNCGSDYDLGGFM